MFDFGAKIIDKVWPNPAERDAAKLELFKAQQAGQFKEMDQAFESMKAQIGVNAVEAASADPFTSRWRPFIGWVCGTGLALQFIVNPMATWIATIMGHSIAFPNLDLGTLMTLLFGMLGLGALRTHEKVKGVA
jgi:hypothetical protein